MKKWRCFKRVEAGKILEVYKPGDKLPDGVSTVSGGGWLVRVEGEPHWLSLSAKHQPEVGGYFVRYEDGYTSYSPAKAFESGYSELF